MVRQLAPWHENVGKHQVKAPKVCFWDSGLLHCLLRQAAFADLQVHPKLAVSREGLVLEQILSINGVEMTTAWPHTQAQVWLRGGCAVHDEVDARGAAQSETGTAVCGAPG